MRSEIEDAANERRRLMSYFLVELSNEQSSHLLQWCSDSPFRLLQVRGFGGQYGWLSIWDRCLVHRSVDDVLKFGPWEL